MNDNINYEQIARYVAGECSEKEASEIKLRMKNDQELAKIVGELQKIWKTKKQRSISWDVESAWKRFSEELDRAGKLPSEKPVKNRTIHTPHKTKKSWILSIAAVFMVIALTSLFAVFYFGDFEQEEQFVTKEVITEKGQRVQVQLTDGSRIHLNAASKITYPEQFESDNRTVHLTGEAYFDINRDERPFFVYTDEVVVEILGTEFNVQAYEEEDVEVVVANGKVGVKLTNNTNGDSAILQRGEMARVDRRPESGLILMQEVDLNRHLGWMEYHLIFDDVPMYRVLRQLERWYGVDIDYTDPAIAELTLSANFEDEPLQTVLQVMKLALNLDYRIQGNNVTLYPDS